MAKKVGTLIKEARTAAGLTQAELAKKVDGVSAADISKAERGEKELSQAALKQIAKATGVTQASLLNAAKKGSSTSSTASSSGSSSMKLNASEKKLIELYRKADSKTRTAAMKVLKGEKNETEEVLSTLIGTVGDVMDMLSGKEKK